MSQHSFSSFTWIIIIIVNNWISFPFVFFLLSSVLTEIKALEVRYESRWNHNNLQHVLRKLHKFPYILDWGHTAKSFTKGKKYRKCLQHFTPHNPNPRKIFFQSLSYSLFLGGLPTIEIFGVYIRFKITCVGELRQKIRQWLITSTRNCLS